jgi:hypothetical protein
MSDHDEQVKTDSRALYNYIADRQIAHAITRAEAEHEAGVPPERARAAVEWLRSNGVLNERYNRGVAYVSVCITPEAICK